ncbi:VanZ family protein [Prauserella cavernicola]|uniref:VanZ family protein n=1 Tax=Prauserella cavernicola TaxID=2800127 RepID=A0A934V3X6_9PSEU|nr:VanZ family protein [Prauserella cavernicola]MBK1784827.1 VanZ family protein [Prauserella cavernicola]
MEILLRSFGILVPIAVLTLPFALLAWRLLTVWRARRRPARQALVTAGLDVAIVLVAALVLALVTMPFPGPGGVSLVPGEDLGDALTDNASFWQVAANVVMLLPLGILLPLRWRFWQGVRRVALAALMASIGIEAMQYFIDAGRFTSTDDVLLNTVGAALGASLVRRSPEPVFIALRGYPSPAPAVGQRSRTPTG